MRSIRVIIFFALFLGASAFLSEFTLQSFLKDLSMSHGNQFSFFYGWVKHEGKETFFIQEDFNTELCSQDSIKSEEAFRELISQVLADQAIQPEDIDVNLAGCFSDINSMSGEKRRLIKDKKDILEVSNP